MKSADINLRLVELANGLIATIDQDAVRAIVDETSTLLGASHWVFASIAPETSPIESYRFLVGCPAEWCQIYERNHWYLTDPVMQYALLEEAKEFGFAEGMVIPAHAANNIRVGALYLSYAAAGTMPRELLEAARSALRALAATLLDWDIACLRSEFLNETRLTQREIWMLDYELSGFTAQDIARFEGVSVNSINRSFGSIINKMGVANKHEAAQLALASGLVSQAMGA
jgi:DNA-binding CsgD family transcriptional regulator